MNHLDLFSGVGCFSFAAKKVWGDDLNTTAFYEPNKQCQMILRQHFPGVPIRNDVRDYDNSDTADIILGGDPCPKGNSWVGETE